METAKRERQQYKELTERIEKNGWDVKTLISASPHSEPVNPQILQMQQMMAEKERKLTALEQRIEKKEQINEIKQFIDSNKDDFELTHLRNYSHKVKELIDYHYETRKELLTIPEAAKAIELELENYQKEEAQLGLKSKKVKDIYSSVFDPTSKTKAPSTKSAADKPQDTPSEPPASKKPEAIVPPIPKMPSLKFKEVSPSGAPETSGTIKPNAARVSKEATIAKILKQFQMG